MEPFLIKKNLRQALDHIRILVEDYGINKIIIGYPLNMDGTRNKMTRKVEEFASFLTKNLINMNKKTRDINPIIE
jgi:putative transcription antitermination factor YqgF